ncbi:MAG TPA: glutamine synthetase type III, partial [Segetibacter sp.]
NGVYAHDELEARHEIELEKYIKKVQIEARVMGEIATNFVLPAAMEYQNVIITNIKGLKEVGLKDSASQTQRKVLEKLSDLINSLSDDVTNMIEARKVCNNMTNSREKAIAYCNDVKDKYFDKIRYNLDKLEMLVPDEKWTLPKYREMLFLR